MMIRYLLNFQMGGHGAEVILVSMEWKAISRPVISLITSILMPLTIDSIVSKLQSISRYPRLQAERTVQYTMEVFCFPWSDRILRILRSSRKDIATALCQLVSMFAIQTAYCYLNLCFS